jgi:hypothetical protein
MINTDIKYFDVRESIGMGGPFLGRLSINGCVIPGRFLVDNEKVISSQKCIVFSRLVGEGFKRDFRIFIYNAGDERFFQSKTSYTCLAIEEMKDELITFHKAFHTSFSEYRDSIEFNRSHFEEVIFKRQ